MTVSENFTRSLRAAASCAPAYARSPRVAIYLVPRTRERMEFQMRAADARVVRSRQNEFSSGPSEPSEFYIARTLKRSWRNER